MPQPTLGDVHVNRPLTNISVAYSQEAAGVEFVADRAFPADPRRKQKRPVLHLQARRLEPRRDAEARASSTESAGAGLRPRFDGHVQLRRLGAAQGCGRPDPREQRLAARARSRRDHLPDQQGAHPPRESCGPAQYFKTGVWTGEVAGQAASDSTHVAFWDYATSSPITDIRHAKTQARLNSGGFVPNIGVFSRPVFDKLVDHPDFIDRTKYGQTAPNPAMATRRIIAEILELEEVLVMDAVYNTAAEGATESNSFIGGHERGSVLPPEERRADDAERRIHLQLDRHDRLHRRRRTPHQDVPHGASGVRTASRSMPHSTCAWSRRTAASSSTTSSRRCNHVPSADLDGRS